MSLLKRKKKRNRKKGKKFPIAVISSDPPFLATPPVTADSEILLTESKNPNSELSSSENPSLIIESIPNVTPVSVYSESKTKNLSIELSSSEIPSQSIDSTPNEPHDIFYSDAKMVKQLLSALPSSEVKKEKEPISPVALPEIEPEFPINAEIKVSDDEFDGELEITHDHSEYDWSTLTTDGLSEKDIEQLKEFMIVMNELNPDRPIFGKTKNSGPLKPAPKPKRSKKSKARYKKSKK